MSLWYCRQRLHGDLRSPNLFVGSDGKVKIGDFGFCMELPQGKKAVKVDKVTHPCWTAPEVRGRGGLYGGAVRWV